MSSLSRTQRKRYLLCFNHLIHGILCQSKQNLEGRIYLKPPLLLIPTAISGCSQTTLKLRNSLEGFPELGARTYLWYCCRGRQGLKSAQEEALWDLWSREKVHETVLLNIHPLCHGWSTHSPVEENKNNPGTEPLVLCDSDKWERKAQRKKGPLLSQTQLCIIWLMIASVYRSLLNKSFQNKSPRTVRGWWKTSNCPLCNLWPLA